MNDCPNAEIRDLLPDLLHDQLDPATRARVERHVLGCVDCTAEMALLRRVRGALARVPQVDVARIAAVAVGARSVAPVRRPVRRAWRAAAAIAAVAVGSLGVVLGAEHGIFGRSGVSPRPADAVAVVNNDTGTAGSGAEAALGFAGGVSDLDTRQLEKLLADLDHLDTSPVMEPPNVVPSITGGVS